MKSGLQKVKEASKNLVDKSKRLLSSQITNNIAEAVTKCTWNDNDLPKSKWKIILSAILLPPSSNSITPPNIYIDRETFLMTLEERLNHYKWKVAFKAVLLVQEFSIPSNSGDYIFYVLSNRPKIFSTRYIAQTTTYANQTRSQSINHLITYNEARLKNFLKYGRTLAGFKDKSSLDLYINKRFNSITLLPFLKDNISQLGLINNIVFPNMGLANSCTIYTAELMRNEALIIVEELKYIILAEITKNKEKEFIEKVDKLVGSLEKVVGKIKIWIGNLSTEYPGSSNVRYENNSVNTNLGDMEQIKNIINRIKGNEEEVVEVAEKKVEEEKKEEDHVDKLFGDLGL